MKTVWASITISCLSSMVFLIGFTFYVQPVRAEPKTWTVDDDGPADFQTIQGAINAASGEDTIFVLNGTYYENVVVNKTLSLIGEDKQSTIVDGDLTGNVLVLGADNIIVTGFTIRRGGSNSGILVGFRDCNSTIADCIVSDNEYGIHLDTESSNSKIVNNLVSNNYPYGIFMRRSFNNDVANNTLSLNDDGIYLYQSWNNTIIGNVLTNNSAGILLGKRETSGNLIADNHLIGNSDVGIRLHDGPQDNLIYHNSFLSNTNQAFIGYPSHFNIWDNGYPSGGNYWSEFTGNDTYSGLYHNETGSDGISDIPYVVDENNQDNYPLMGTFSDFNATSEHHVQTICNSTIADFMYNGTAISFNVVSEDGTVGFCRTCIPTALMNETYQVFVNGTEVPHTILPCSNSTHSYLYFTYNHSTQEVVIIPEFPSVIVIPLFMMSTLLAAILYRRKHSM